jgi:hypothetical protein
MFCVCRYTAVIETVDYLTVSMIEPIWKQRKLEITLTGILFERHQNEELLV